ncbi:prepilin-type N-terminal cleavage/methylation domain-containing protein [Stenotrophobium rhamnosiphilum]|uniref:Prepilin-type cleavage/methylation domain-containing protein n=1 Tax=Stenotrophobium rhamnosiphilum TaxID=2029166 RepID=A0A2T5ML61_9GAMM|nr:prepilin-type N-terminal cleavage/methylation domain-containing protein [Stenotrophobium rhamnosiphilum]PTU33317.1 prepilin-type cleavage/methylation domain-containing protein [Stenotrophobium rhamnosiphilum]
MRSATHHQLGFTLVELMIAMLLGLLIIGGVIAVFLSNKQTYATHNAMSQVQDSARNTFEMLSRDIRETGLTGCGNAGRIANVLNSGPSGAATKIWAADMANAIRGYDSGTVDPAVPTSTATTAPTDADVGQRVSTTSSIQLVGGDGLGLTVASHDATTAKITLNETTALLAAGDLIVVCDPDHAAIAQVTSLAGSPAVLTLATGTAAPGNCSTGLGFPTQCTTAGSVYTYIANSQVSKLYAVDWFIGFNPLGGKSLYRIGLTAGVPTAAQEMVRNVSDMQITYHRQNATAFTSAAAVTDWTLIDAVMLTLKLESANKFAGGTTNKPITRDIPITVTLRNRVQ